LHLDPYKHLAPLGHTCPAKHASSLQTRPLSAAKHGDFAASVRSVASCCGVRA